MDQIPTIIADHSATTGFVYGLGPTMLALNAMAEEIARSDMSVLILGESGTGKDAYARLIHRLSPWRNSRLRKLNCSAFQPGDLGAHVNEAVCTTSDAGLPQSVYLDNIQELDPAAQRELLARLPDADGVSSTEAPVVRFISSTTRNLEPEVAAGRFRRELYFRLNGACLRLPPLRERKEDIPVLTEYFLTKHATITKKKAPTLSSKVFQSLTAYHWPGNIRELENLVRKIVVLGDSQVALNDLRSSSILTDNPAIIAQGASLKLAARAASKQAERELIMQALERTRWNRKRAARELQISYKALLYKLKQIG